MEQEKNCVSHPFLAWTQVLAKTHVSPLPFFTPLLGGLFNIVQTSTSYEAAQLYLRHFLKREIKSEGETDSGGKMFHCKSVSREAGVQQSLPPRTLLSPRDHPASVLCRNEGGSLLGS